MPQGYYTIEKWARQSAKARPRWIAVLQLPFGTSLTAAESAARRLGPGFYRVVQMQRVIWAENEDGKLRLRKSHAGSPESLAKMSQMFERCGGVYPVEEVREARRRAKRKRAARS
jgi:hypothetical protein